MSNAALFTLGKTFAGIGVLCLAVALTAGIIAGVCFDAADRGFSENG